jgi:hypothetical protein
MESETSAIARKLQDFVLIENTGLPPPTRAKHNEQRKKEEPGIFKNILLIALMASAVFFTHITLVLVKWTKRLEE